MFGLWDRKGKSGEPLPEANHGRQIRIGHQACARAATSNRASRQRVICPSHSTAEWLTRPVAPYETVDERATGFRCRHCRQGFVVPREQSSFAEIFGVNSHIRSICDRLVFEGHTAIAPALFERRNAGMERSLELLDRACKT